MTMSIPFIGNARFTFPAQLVVSPRVLIIAPHVPEGDIDDLGWETGVLALSLELEVSKIHGKSQALVYPNVKLCSL